MYDSVQSASGLCWRQIDLRPLGDVRVLTLFLIIKG